jgi:hypothetical protein
LGRKISIGVIAASASKAVEISPNVLYHAKRTFGERS